MDTTISIDLGHIARELNLPIVRVQRTLELLDDGNTVPFITRYRKDQTGALDEQQIRAIQLLAVKLRALADRKQTILKSIESQGRLTPELAEIIRTAPTAKRLEDLYLPFKQKKQSHATLARQRGLEPLARAILEAGDASTSLEDLAAAYVSEEKSLPTTAEVLQGVRYILAETYSESVELRDRLRKVLRQQGKLVATRLESAERKSETAESAEVETSPDTETSPDAGADHAATNGAGDVATGSDHGDMPSTAPGSETPPADSASSTESDAAPQAAAAELAPPNADAQPADAAAAASAPATPTAAETSAAETTAADATAAPTTTVETTTAATRPATARPGRDDRRRAQTRSARASKKEKKRQKLESAFKDYFQFSESLTRIPPHRVLAINRGERARILKVRVEWDSEAMLAAAEKAALPEGHPYHEFLAGCLRDALHRLILPSLEREARRELTEFAEEHAVDVFVRNLRKLLLQPPIHGHRLLAVDPGFRNGCKLIAIDEFGNVLGHDIMHVVGRDDRRKDARTKIADMIRRFGLSVVAIGNGTGCRESEQLVADVIGKELNGMDLAYVIVNEAGASVYSTSPIGREELPNFDPVLRSAISIGRRLLDPLSELVKINPANIGVGLYQHDVKAKHLRDSLDAVVESCVNYVGVDANTASPALLRYVSGMNQLTARRFYEYRCQNGPFRTREQFADVPGFGDATFVQAAGFLQVRDGENPLDATWIHPESYDIARRVLEKLGANVDTLRPARPRVPQRAEAAPPLPIAETPLPAATSEGPADSAVSESTVNESASNTGQAGDASPPTASADAVDSDASMQPAAAASVAVAASPVADIAAPTATDHAETEKAETDDAEAQRWAAEAEARQAARAQLSERAAHIQVAELATELGVGELLLRDILSALTRSGRDPREDLPPPVFRRGIMKLEDLKPGMELTGTVLNVVDFGAFVDIGLTESGLVHISRLADRYIRDPHEVVGVGDTVKVWVLDIDRERRRVSLTAVPPGTERRRAEPRAKSKVAAAAAPAAASAGSTAGGGAPPARSSRPPRSKRQPQRGQRARPAQGRSWTSKSKMPSRPLTKEMEEGKEPLRSFGDLLQFYEKKNKNDDSDSETE